MKSTLAHDAVAAVVLHEHHLIIRVGADLIQFVYGSHSRMAADLTLDKNLFLLPFSRAFWVSGVCICVCVSVPVQYTREDYSSPFLCYESVCVHAHVSRHTCALDIRIIICFRVLFAAPMCAGACGQPRKQLRIQTWPNSYT